MLTFTALRSGQNAAIASRTPGKRRHYVQNALETFQLLWQTAFISALLHSPTQRLDIFLASRVQ